MLFLSKSREPPIDITTGLVTFIFTISQKNTPKAGGRGTQILTAISHMRILHHYLQHSQHLAFSARG